MKSERLKLVGVQELWVELLMNVFHLTTNCYVAGVLGLIL